MTQETLWPITGLRSRLLLALIFLFLIGLFFHKMAFSNLILARGDTFLYFYPYWQAAADALRDGRIPLWNPYLFMGVPFVANSQAGFFYPLNWPLWWRLPPPYAVSASILIHVALAAWGAYLAGRKRLQLSRTAAVLAGVLFALGGYLTAQVEHVNQLQGLAWLPWFLVVLGKGGRSGRHGLWRKGTAVAVLFSLQLLAGHAQTAFITGVGVSLWLLADTFLRGKGGEDEGSRFRAHTFPHRFSPLLLGVLLALLLAAVQLLPSLELAQFSSRQRGLPVNEALSFSLHPLLLSRVLLPGYGVSLFTEYVAFLPITGLLLALVAAGQWRRREVLPILTMAAGGLILAFGRFNPLYSLILVRLPGFNLFRAPARWLALYALGTALLAGIGWDLITSARHKPLPQWQAQIGRPLRRAGALLLALMAWGLASAPLARFIPIGPEAPVEWPSLLTGAGWLGELAAAYVLLSLPGRERRLFRHGSPRLLAIPVLFLVLFLASRSLPYNQLTTPEAYFDWRPPMARLRAAAACLPASERRPICSESGGVGRFLSLSGIFFDPGDQAEIETIYADQLSEAALYDYTIAIKQKEIIAPNLPLAYRLPSVDGFDGGILPLSAYSDAVGLMLPDGVRTTDGRLREFLPAVPEPHWLDLFNVRYLITDKVGDAWVEGVFFDLQHPAILKKEDTVEAGYLPPYEATELWLAAEAPPKNVRMTTEGGETWVLDPVSGGDIWRVPFPHPATLSTIHIQGCRAETAHSCRILGLTLVDVRDDTFRPLVLGAYRLIHSGDVKIYENLDVLPRAFLVTDWQWQPDMAAGMRAMRSLGKAIRETAVLLGEGIGPEADSPQGGAAEILVYEPERVVVRSRSDRDALLVLTDAYYPGWRAFVDGNPVEIHQADGMFRAVFVPEGIHEVTFSFTPASFAISRWITVAALIGMMAGQMILVFGTAFRRRVNR
ncbi:MAG: YfhO family protein [Anaerolineae bacterium]